MPQNINTILADRPPLHQNSYRAAVASVINAIKAEFGESDQDVADRLGTSASTINNASNKRGDLGALTLLRIGKEYGIHRIDPIVDLIGAKMAAIDAVCTSDLHLPIGAARGQLFLAKALEDEVITDDEIFEGAEDIEAGYQTFGSLKWRLDGLRRKREACA